MYLSKARKTMIKFPKRLIPFLPPSVGARLSFSFGDLYPISPLNTFVAETISKQDRWPFEKNTALIVCYGKNVLIFDLIIDLYFFQSTPAYITRKPIRDNAIGKSQLPSNKSNARCPR